jgi:hypothetical protein
MEPSMATVITSLLSALCPVCASILFLRLLPPRRTKGIPAIMKLQGAAGTWREPVQAN